MDNKRRALQILLDRANNDPGRNTVFTEPSLSQPGQQQAAYIAASRHLDRSQHHRLNDHQHWT